MDSQRAGAAIGGEPVSDLVDLRRWNHAIVTSYLQMSYDIDEMSRMSGLAACDLIGSGEGESRVAAIACVRSITAKDSDLYELPPSCFYSF